MAKEEPIELTGTVTQVLPGTMFRGRAAQRPRSAGPHSGKMRKNFIRISVGDRVNVEMSPYDLGKARITFRPELTAQMRGQAPASAGGQAREPSHPSTAGCNSSSAEVE